MHTLNKALLFFLSVILLFGSGCSNKAITDNEQDFDRPSISVISVMAQDALIKRPNGRNSVIAILGILGAGPLAIGIIDDVTRDVLYGPAKKEVKFLDDLLQDIEVDKIVHQELEDKIADISWGDIGLFETRSGIESMSYNELAEHLRSVNTDYVLVVNTVYAISGNYNSLEMIVNYKLYSKNSLRDVERINPPRYDLLKPARWGSVSYAARKYPIMLRKKTEEEMKKARQEIEEVYEQKLAEARGPITRKRIRREYERALRTSTERVAAEDSNYRGNLWVKSGGALLKEDLLDGIKGIAAKVAQKVSKLDPNT